MFCINPQCTISNRGDICLIKNNTTGKIYKINESQYEFITYIKDNSYEITESMLELEYVRMLMDIGVLIEKKKEEVLRKKFVFDDLWHFRFEILNPDVLCERILKISSNFVFKLVAVVAIIIAVFFSVPFMINNRYLLMQTSGHLEMMVYLLTMYMISIILSIGHEFSHALLCKKFGGNVDEMGIAILYLNPSFYCNISDSYFFKEKWKRVLVPAIGIIYDILAILLITAMLRYVNVGWIFTREYLKLSFLMLLFELNPLLKHDGYYILTELLSVYNLRENAIKELKKIFKRGSKKNIKRTYLFYGIASCSYLTFHLLILGQTLVGFGKVFFINKN